MERFLARTVPATSRLDHWNAQLSDLFAGLVADPDDRDDFDGSLQWCATGPLTAAVAASKRCRMHHPATSGPGGDSGFVLKLQLRGRSLAEHVGQEALLKPGDLILFDTDKAHRLTLLDDSEMLALCVPKAVAGDKLRLLEPLAGICLPSDNPSVRLCGDYAESLWRLTRDNGPEGIPTGSANVLLDLIGLCAPRRVGDAPRHSRADWQTIQQYLSDRLLEPELSVTRISADLGVTPRRLQQICAENGTTPARHILENRLREARRRLCDRDFAGQSVTDIALDVGFGDVTYFGRAFRTRYGSSPMQFRRSVSNH